MPYTKVRDYKRLFEAADLWGLSQADILDSALRGMLNLSVLVAKQHVIHGKYKKTADGSLHPTNLVWESYSGLLNLTEETLFAVKHKGYAEADTFKPNKGHDYTWVIKRNIVPVKMEDILIESTEFYRFGMMYNLAANDQRTIPDFLFENDFRHVHFRGRTWSFGDIQANVVRTLYRAALTGEKWVNGKLLLHEAGSTSLRLNDIFRKQPFWRDLIISDSKGYYALNV